MQQRPSLSLAKLLVAAVCGVGLALVISTVDRQWRRHNAAQNPALSEDVALSSGDLQAWPVAAGQMTGDLAPPDYVRPYAATPYAAAPYPTGADLAIESLATPGETIAQRLFGNADPAAVQPPYRLPSPTYGFPNASPSDFSGDVEDDLAQDLYYPPEGSEGPQMIINSLVNEPTANEPTLAEDAADKSADDFAAESFVLNTPVTGTPTIEKPADRASIVGMQSAIPEVAAAMPEAKQSSPAPELFSDESASDTLAADTFNEELLIESLEDPDATFARETPTDLLMADLPAVAEIEKLVTPDLHAAYGLGRSGALYRAREEFVAVLQKIALARDTAQTTDRHTVALKIGLRAIDEADDFVPLSATVDQPLTVAEVAASHQTPLLHDQKSLSRWSLPHEAVALYHRYAQRKLAGATAGSQAGSMALHGLGKTYARLAVLEEDEHADRMSRTMYRAALLTRADNYLAANELGVSLASVGRSQQARLALEQAVTHGGNSTVFRNLASVQQKLGQGQLAMAAQQRADQLANAEMSRGMFSRQRGVRWVSPDEFNQTGRNSGQSPAVASARPPQARPQPGQPAPQMASRPQRQPATNNNPSLSWWQRFNQTNPNQPRQAASQSASQMPPRRPVTRVPGTTVTPPARTRLGQMPPPQPQRPGIPPGAPVRNQRVLR